MKASSLIAALVVVAAIGSIAFVGISENIEAFSSEQIQKVVIPVKDSVTITDSVTVTVNAANSSG